MKKFSYLFLSTSLILIAITPINIKANDESLNKDLNVLLEQGEFSLETSEPIGFGTHKIENKKKIVTTGFQNNFIVTDARGTQEGWQLTVSASPFTIIEPPTGFAPGTGPYALPTGSFSLKSVDNVIGLNNEPEETYPFIEFIDKAIDLNEAIKVSNANVGKGMGEYALMFGSDALSLIVDPITAKIDKINYPNQMTPYESTITWDLISGPGDDYLNTNNISNKLSNELNNDIDMDAFSNGLTSNYILDEENLNSFNINNIDTMDNNIIKKVEDINKKKIIDLHKDDLIVKEDEFIYKSDAIVSSSKEKTITIPNLNKIQSIIDLNGGDVSILSVKGNEVTVRVNNGYSYKELFLGDYYPSETKSVTDQTSPIYNQGGYKGTLSAYQHEIVPATVKPISKIFYSKSNNFPATEYYEENNLMTTLTKKGSPNSREIGGLDSQEKYITDYHDSYYSDEQGYTGYLNEYTRTEIGEPTYFEVYESSLIPDFEQKIHHVEGNYSGTLELKDYVLDEKTNEYIATYTGYLQAPVVKKFYEGTVSTPDTRVYEYMQEYVGMLDVPAITETRYQGTVVKDALDTRVYQDIYEYDLIIKYIKK